MQDLRYWHRSLLPSAFQRAPLGWQYAISLFFVVALIWGLIGTELRRLSSIAERESKVELRNLSLAFSEEVNSTISMIDLSLISLRSQWLDNRNDFRHSVQYLQSHLEKNLRFHVSIVDANGKLIFSSIDPHVKAIDLSDREHIRAHRPGTGDKLFISSPVQGRISGEWSIQFTRPIYNLAGQFDGVLVFSVSPNFFSRFYREIDIGNNAVVTLVREGGVVIARSSSRNEMDGIGRVLTGGQFQNASQRAKGFYRRHSLVDGVDRFYAWRTLPRYALIVMVGQSALTISKRYQSEQHTYLLGGVGISILLAIIGLLLLTAARQRMRDAQALAESEARWKLAIEGSGDGAWDWDMQKQVIQFSKRSMEILGIVDQSYSSKLEVLDTLIYGEDIPVVLDAIRAHLAGQAPSYVTEHRVPDKDGSLRWILARGTVVKRSAEDKPLRMVGTVSDIQERKTRDELIQHSAHHDALTGLPNRLLLSDRLQQALLRARRQKTELAVIYFDLDKFKPVNDTFGHSIGDLLLKAVAYRVRSALRESDTVARIGGDEFVVLLPIHEEAAAVAVAQNILAQLNKPFDIEGHTLCISGSVGVATYPKDGDNEEELTNRADQAMYQAKESGRNRVVRYQPVLEE